MRQFFTWRFWLSLLVLAGLTFGVYSTTRSSKAVTEVIQQVRAPERHVDLIALVYLAQADPGFAIVDGRTTANMQIRIDGFRYMNIHANTPGENRCGEIAQLARCAVAADLLGEAVLWFSIVPVGERNQVLLPPVTELNDDGTVRLENGWIVRHADVVKRLGCDDTTSLPDFIQRHGEGSTTAYDLDQQAVVSVTCDTTTATTTTAAPPTTGVTPTVPATVPAGTGPATTGLEG
jgi:hypothetical protein